MGSVTQLDKALSYAKAGIAVFPCKKDKRPATTNGFNDATTNESTIRTWWTKNKNALIGAPNDQFVVIDDDSNTACPSGKILTETAINQLQSEGIINKSSVVVTTMSGGKHYYFRRDKELDRHINILPNIDLLANGGYTVLPDQTNYVCETYKTPWSKFTDLPPLKKDTFQTIVEQFEEISKTAKELKKQFRSTTKKTQKVKTKDMSSIPKGKGEDISGLKTDINYKSGDFTFEQTEGMYEKTQGDYVVSSEVKWNDDGTLNYSEGEIDSGVINALFHDQKVQEKLAKFMGLKLPRFEKGSLMHSCLPGHVDNRPSMGVRWSEDRTHLIIRDFSNHFSDKFQQVDYNIIRLYATTQYGTLVPRMNAPEFVVWFIRMLYEAKLLKLTFKKFDPNHPKVTKSEMKVANGFLLLDAVKSMYSGYDGISVFADKFASGWCSVCPSTANRAKKRLASCGYIKDNGTYDCSKGKRDDGFYETTLFSVVENRPKYISAFEQKAKRDKEKANKQEEDMNKKSKPQLMTSVELPVSQQSYDKILNFAVDFELEEVPERKNMMIPLTVTKKIVDVNVDLGDVKFYMGDLHLEVTERFDGQGDVLLLIGECPPIERMYHQYQQDEQLYSDIMDEPLMGVVISSNFTTENRDVTFLAQKLTEYLEGTIMFQDLQVRYETEDNLFNFVFDGMRPEED